MHILTPWTVAAIISQAVQCPLHQPWNIHSHGCRNLVCGNITFDWSTLLKPCTRTLSILHTTRLKSPLTSLSFSLLSSFDEMFRFTEARNWPSIQSLQCGFCRSSHGQGEQSLLIQRSSVCMTVAFEMASLKIYNGNPDKPCESRCCSGATLANSGSLRVLMLMLPSGGSTKIP